MNNEWKNANQLITPMKSYTKLKGNEERKKGKWVNYNEKKEGREWKKQRKKIKLL